MLENHTRTCSRCHTVSVFVAASKVLATPLPSPLGSGGQRARSSRSVTAIPPPPLPEQVPLPPLADQSCGGGAEPENERGGTAREGCEAACVLEPSPFARLYA